MLPGCYKLEAGNCVPEFRSWRLEATNWIVRLLIYIYNINMKLLVWMYVLKTTQLSPEKYDGLS